MAMRHETSRRLDEDDGAAVNVLKHVGRPFGKNLRGSCPMEIDALS